MKKTVLVTNSFYYLGLTLKKQTQHFTFSTLAVLILLVFFSANKICANEKFNSSYSALNEFLVDRIENIEQTITFDALSAKTYGDQPFTLNASSDSNLTISYTSSDTNVVTIVGNVVTIVGTGIVTITASQEGNEEYDPAIPVPRDLVVNKANQTITFSELSPMTYGGQTFTLSASTTSGLSIVYSSSNTNVATVSGNTVTIVGVGTTAIIASQAGDDNYYAATSVPNELVVSKANQTITFAALSDKTYGDETFTLSASTTSGLSLSYSSSNTDVATVSGNTVTIIGVGTTTITASQSGNSNFNSATSATQELVVNKAILTIKANDQTVCSGTQVSSIINAGNYSVTGYVNNDYLSVISGTITFTSSYLDTNTSEDTPIITPVISELSATNYQFEASSGNINIINTLSAPTASAQSFCTSATVEDLQATGTDLKWYAAATGGEVLASDAALSSNNYYVSQTANSCESTRTEVAVVVNTTEAPTASAQSFCNSGTVEDLQASGTDLKWYSGETSEEVLASSEALTSGNYYVSQTENLCESTRLAVVVNVLLAPEAVSQTFCSSDSPTVDDIVASGSVLKWYLEETGGESLDSTTPLITGNYYVTQSGNNCETNRTLVAIIVNLAPSANPQSFCISNNPTVENLVATGESLKWYTAQEGGSALASSDSLTTGNYYVSQTIDNCETLRTEVAITIDSAASVGDITALSTTVCNRSSATMTLDENETTGSISWFKSLNYDNSNPESAVWLGLGFTQTITNTFLNTGALSYSTSISNTRSYKAVAKNGTCTSTSNIVTVTISPAVKIQKITAGPATVCTGSGTTLTLATGSVGSIQWQKSIISATEEFVDVDSLIDAATPSNGVVTLSTGDLTQDTWYRIVFTNGACSSNSVAVKVTVNATSTVGELTTDKATVCTGTGTTLTLGESTGTVSWYKSTNYVNSTNTTPVWTLVPLSVNVNESTLATGNLIYSSARPIVWYKAVANSGVCSAITSNIVSVTILPLPITKTITASQATVCTGSGTTLTLATGSVGSIQWQKSTTSASEEFENVDSVIAATTPTNGIVSLQTGNLTQETWYRIGYSNAACSLNSASVKVSVSQVPSVGQLATEAATVCTKSGTNLTLSASTGSVAWYKSTNYVNTTDTTPVWSLIPLSASVTNTDLATGILSYSTIRPTTWYKAVVTNGACNLPSNIVSVTVSSVPVKRTITVFSPTVCTGSGTTLTIGSGSIGSIQWQKSNSATFEEFENINTIIDATAPSNGVKTLSTGSLTQNTWYRIVFTNGACSLNSDVVKVTVSEVPSVGVLITEDATVCTATGTNLSLGTSSGTVAWFKSTSYVSSTGLGSWTSVTSNVTESSLATGNLIYSSLKPTTWYKAVVKNGACTSPSNIVSVTVSPAAKATAIKGFNTATTQVCVGTTKTLSLTSGYVGTIEWLSSNTLEGTYTVIEGATNTTYNYTPTTTATMYFKVRFTSSPCSATASSTAGVAVFAKSCSTSTKMENNNPLPTSKVFTPFSVKAFPNPYDSTFQLNFTTTSESLIEMRVYDMIGKLIETRQFSINEMNNQELGSSYPSGIYNVIVSQGEEMKTLRLVKK